ncbi:MAG: flavin reductase family protein [Armatimonadetes bacterium]|nr:flavin reductase family protein [Armatimonadota bacterium]
MIEVEYSACVSETLHVMTNLGLLLVSVDKVGKPNAMTIGWGTIGSIWGKPTFCVLVRPSRYTFDCIEATNDFTVNVPPQELREAVGFCGRFSGREHDKFTEMKLTAAPSLHVKSPVIEQCPIQYECKVIHRNEVIPENLPAEILESAYPGGNYHTVYFGEILAVHADPEAKVGL